MTKAEIDAVLERVRTWPVPKQEEAAQVLLTMEGLNGTELFALSDEEEAALDEAELEIQRGEVASDAEVEAVLYRFHAA